jgi:membrane protein
MSLAALARGAGRAGLEAKHIMSLAQPGPNEAGPYDWQHQPAQTPARQPSGRGRERRKKEEQEARKAIKTLSGFWTKINNDWIFNLSSMLAYNLLMSIVPILAMLLSFFGFFLGGLAPGVRQEFINSVVKGLPQGAGKQFIGGALTQLSNSSGIFAVITVLVSIWFGSRLFITIESCFGVIYRLPTRAFVRQNIVAIGMLIIFAVLIPIMLAVSAAPSFLSTTIVDRLLGNSIAERVWLAIAGIIAGWVVSTILFLAVYIVVPNRPARVRDAWLGAVVAGALLEIYMLAFPFYAAHFLHPQNYGSTAGFAVVILIFFYYFGFILLLGGEINSFRAGQGQTKTDLPGILYEAQVQKTANGAAGPTAGRPQENLQADRRGLDVTMTPAEDKLSPPGSDTQAHKEEAEKR